MYVHPSVSWIVHGPHKHMNARLRHFFVDLNAWSLRTFAARVAAATTTQRQRTPTTTRRRRCAATTTWRQRRSAATAFTTQQQRCSSPVLRLQSSTAVPSRTVGKVAPGTRSEGTAAAVRADYKGLVFNFYYKFCRYMHVFNLVMDFFKFYLL